LKRRILFKIKSLCKIVYSTTVKNESAMINNYFIPTEATRIEDNAFMGCESLTHIRIPSNIEVIGIGAFKGCKNLKRIVIPDSVNHIDYSAFCYSGLTSIIIPGSVEYIKHGAFAYCRDLSSVEICNGVRSIGEAAFADCSSLKSIVIPTSVEYIGDEAFADCSSLEKVVISSRDTTLAGTVFYNCKALRQIVVPEMGIRNVYGREREPDITFLGCENLSSIVIEPNSDAWDNAAKLLSNPLNRALKGLNLSKITLYVPAVKEDAYRSIPFYSQFKGIVATTCQEQAE
jgi:hypothetical protein